MKSLLKIYLDMLCLPVGPEEICGFCGAPESDAGLLPGVLCFWDDPEVHVRGKCLEKLGPMEKRTGGTRGPEIFRYFFLSEWKQKYIVEEPLA